MATVSSHTTVTSITVDSIGTAGVLAVDVEIHLDTTIFASISDQSHFDSSVSKLTVDMATTSENATIGHDGELAALGWGGCATSHLDHTTTAGGTEDDSAGFVSFRLRSASRNPWQ